MSRDLAAIGLLGAAALAGTIACRAPAFLTTPRVSGTCDGACDHYYDCLGRGESPDQKSKCLVECVQVFSDADSLRAFESLSCDDTVEYVDGAHRPTAAAVSR